MEKRLKKIDNLLKQQQRILKQLEETKQQHNTELFKVFNRLPIHTIAPDVLIGGLQFVCAEASKNTSTVESWRLAGQKFCGKRPAQKNKPILKQDNKTDTTIQSP
jgi:hypothetical protein